MSSLLLTVAAVSGAASAALGYGLWQRRTAASNSDALNKLLPKSFSATHQFTDTQGSVLLACDMKTASVFIGSIANEVEPVCLPISQLESVALVDTGEKRADEVRLDIALADECRSFFKVNFLGKACDRGSEEYQQARQLADKWHTRLLPKSADIAALKNALGADTTIADSSAKALPRWHAPLAGGLAGVAALSLAAMLVTGEPEPAPVHVARAPAASVQQQQPSATPQASVVASISVGSILDPLQSRIDDLSEFSLTPDNKISRDKIMSSLDEIEAITTQIDEARIVATDDADKDDINNMQILLVATQQDVLPRFRRLYSAALASESDISLKASTGGYASRNLSLAHESLTHKKARNTLFSSLESDLQRLRFERVDFRSSFAALSLGDRSLDAGSDAVLAAALPLIED